MHLIFTISKTADNYSWQLLIIYCRAVKINALINLGRHLILRHLILNFQWDASHQPHCMQGGKLVYGRQDDCSNCQINYNGLYTDD